MGFQVLLVTGTHGNEINGPWFFQQWDKNPELINNYGIKFFKVIGNPDALQVGLRYLDKDLNRSFSSDLICSDDIKEKEVIRARELLNEYGEKGMHPCEIVIDIHSTTAAMGSSLVVYGRRPADLALAALIQSHLGLPIYLHEGDPIQKGFLVESWPCGFVIEIGPAPQTLLQAKTVLQTQLALEVCLQKISQASLRKAVYPNHLVVHIHQESIDYPRDLNGNIDAYLHDECQGQDWKPLEKGSPLFQFPNGEVVRYEGDNSLVPVFINEAAYQEKNIAMSLTKKEVWPFLDEWKMAFEEIIN